MTILNTCWARVVAGAAVLVGCIFGAHATAPLSAQSIYSGKNTDVGGKYACDCTNDLEHSCFCIKGS